MATARRVRCWPFLTVVAGRRFCRYRGKNGHRVGMPKTTFLTHFRHCRSAYNALQEPPRPRPGARGVVFVRVLVLSVGSGNATARLIRLIGNQRVEAAISAPVRRGYSAPADLKSTIDSRYASGGKLSRLLLRRRQAPSAISYRAPTAQQSNFQLSAPRTMLSCMRTLTWDAVPASKVWLPKSR